MYYCVSDEVSNLVGMVFGVLLLLFAAYIIYMSWHFRLFSKQGIPTNGTPIPVLGTMGPLMKNGAIEGPQGDLENMARHTAILWAVLLV